MKKLLHKHTLLAFVCVIVFFVLALFSTNGFNWSDLKYSGNAYTSDELSHITSGYYYLKNGKYLLNPEHPPLIKDIAALPLLVLNPNLPRVSSDGITSLPSYPYKVDIKLASSEELHNSQWLMGKIFLFNEVNNPDLILFLSRTAIILTNTITLLLLFWSLNKVISKRASLISIFFMAFSQFCIANGSLVTMDFLSSILQLIAIVWIILLFKRYLNSNILLKTIKSKEFFLSSIFLSLALLAKFSSLVLLPVTFLILIFYLILTRENKKEIFKKLFLMSILMISSIILVVIFYSLNIRNMSSNDVLSQVASSNITNDLAFKTLSLLSKGNILSKALVEYIIGVLMVFTRVQGYDFSQTIYFHGANYGVGGAGILYFPILYLTKISIGILLLFVSIILLVLSNRKRINIFNNKFIIFITIYGVIYLIFALKSNLQIGLRHILPFIIVSFILLAFLIDKFFEKKLFKGFKLMHLMTLISIFTVISTLASFPYFLSYYNILGGSINDGYKIATDSNYDWGQDMKRLGEWYKDNNIKYIYTDIFTNISLEYYFSDNYKFYNAMEPKLPKDSYFAVSVFRYMNNIYDTSLNFNQKYLKYCNDFYTRVGTSIFIFKVK